MPWEPGRQSHVPTPVRDACLNRDGHRCTAIRQDGTRCPETTNLEAAHWQQWQPGETTTVDMVRTLCHWHHAIETRREAAAGRRARGGNALHPREQPFGLSNLR